jgi:hypothetical protein
VLVCVADAKRSGGVLAPDCKVLGLGLDLGYRLGQTRPRSVRFGSVHLVCLFWYEEVPDRTGGSKEEQGL